MEKHFFLILYVCNKVRKVRKVWKVRKVFWRFAKFEVWCFQVRSKYSFDVMVHSSFRYFIRHYYYDENTEFTITKWRIFISFHTLVNTKNITYKSKQRRHVNNHNTNPHMTGDNNTWTPKLARVAQRKKKFNKFWLQNLLWGCLCDSKLQKTKKLTKPFWR